MTPRVREQPSGGRYERTITWIENNPGATLSEIAYAMECTRERALQILRYGLQEGSVRRDRDRPDSRCPWHWYSKEGVRRS